MRRSSIGGSTAKSNNSNTSSNNSNSNITAAKPKLPFRYPPNATLAEKTECIKKELKSSGLYNTMKQAVKEELIKPNYKLDDVAELIPKILEQVGLKAPFQNAVYELHQQASATKRIPQSPTINDPNLLALYEAILEASCTATTTNNDANINTNNNHINISEALPLRKGPLGNNFLRLTKDDYNEIYSLIFQREDRIDAVEMARKSWTVKMKDSLLELSKAFSMPFIKVKGLNNDSNKQTANSNKELARRKIMESSSAVDSDDESSSGDNDHSSTRRNIGQVFTSKLFLAHIKQIASPNHAGNSSRIVGWGLIKLELKTPDVKELRVMFKEMDPEFRQCGLDEEVKAWFSSERIRIGKKLLEQAHIPMLAQYCKRGTPVSLRAQVWSALLNVHVTQKEVDYFQFLESEIKRVELLTDELLIHDLRNTANDDNFFVFEDVLERILLPFSRDAWVHKNAVVIPTPIQAVTQAPNNQRCGVFPPCGIIPFAEMTFLVAPLCFIYTRTEEVYFIFRKLYSSLFCRLHVISSEPQCMIMLCKLFEDLLQTRDPEVFFHLLQIGVDPLSYAFHWMFTAFATILDTEETLALWDRVIGFQNTYVLAVLAAAIFSFRSSALMKCSTESEVKAVFSNFSRIKVIPLLQYYLFMK